MKKILAVIISVLLVSVFSASMVFAETLPANDTNQTSPAPSVEPVTSAAPTATPEASPAASPEVSPVVSPEVSPAASPAATPEATPSTSPAAEATASPAATPSPTATAAAGTGDTGVSITPDSILYPVKRMIESVQVALTFSAEGKAKILISLANERLLEAQIMTEENKQELVDKTMGIYLDMLAKANDSVKEALKDGKDVSDLIESIQVVEGSSDTVVNTASTVIPQETIDDIQNAIGDMVAETVAVKAFALTKENLSNAKLDLKKAYEQLVAATKSGDQTLIQAAKEKVAAAEAAKKEAEDLKNQMEAYKEEIKAASEDGKAADTGKDKEGKSVKAQQAQKKMEQEVAKLETKLKKIEGRSDKWSEEKIEKKSEKANEIFDRKKNNIEKRGGVVGTTPAPSVSSSPEATAAPSASPSVSSNPEVTAVPTVSPAASANTLMMSVPQTDKETLSLTGSKTGHGNSNGKGNGNVKSK